MSTDATPKCRWCGGPLHRGQCPLVKALEFHPDGFTVKRVEFWPPGDNVVSAATLPSVLLKP
jgi:hypothetical protein